MHAVNVDRKVYYLARTFHYINTRIDNYLCFILFMLEVLSLCTVKDKEVTFLLPVKDKQNFSSVISPTNISRRCLTDIYKNALRQLQPGEHS